MQNSDNKLPIVGAIILAGVIVAGAIMYTKSPAPSNTQPANVNVANQPSDTNSGPANIQVKAGEHILGNPDAKLTLILYTDTECSYCRNFHQTMQQIMNEYGKNGTLKWIYRPFPLEQIHATAKAQAEGAECAAELGGNDKFWQYLDELTSYIVSKDNTVNDLVKTAEKLGLNGTKFKECLISGKYDQKIADSIQEGVNNGVKGTPYSVILGPNNQQNVIPGALPYEQVKQMVDQMLIAQ